MGLCHFLKRIDMKQFESFASGNQECLAPRALVTPSALIAIYPVAARLGSLAYSARKASTGSIRVALQAGT